MNSVLITVLAMVMLAASYQQGVQAKPSKDLRESVQHEIEALLQDEVENKVRANGRKLFKSHDTRITESDLDNILRELQKEERISDQEQGNIQESCDCCYHFGSGCQVCKAAPPNRACQCHAGFFYCWGVVTNCLYPWGYYCKNPDTSYTSCNEGQGDCGGYNH